jgi:hypothetical protein
MTRALLWLCLLGSTAVAAEPRLRSGDVVFQTSRSTQSRAIQQATHSPYSHVGLVEVSRDGVFVLEAISPVSRTPWKRWRARGEGARVTVLRRAGLTDEQRAAVVAAARSSLGRPYDWAFEWGDDALYCSELVRKAYARGAGVELGAMQRLDSLDLTGLKPALVQRYGPEVPLDLELVTPASIAADPDLELVFSTFAPAVTPGS